MSSKCTCLSLSVECRPVSSQLQPVADRVTLTCAYKLGSQQLKSCHVSITDGVFQRRRLSKQIRATSGIPKPISADFVFTAARGALENNPPVYINLYQVFLAQEINWRWRLCRARALHLCALTAHQMPMSIWRINGNHCSTGLDERKAEIHTGRIAMIHHHVCNTYGDEALGRQYGEADRSSCWPNSWVAISWLNRGIPTSWDSGL
jgi:hypothetical protein